MYECCIFMSTSYFTSQVQLLLAFQNLLGDLNLIFDYIWSGL